MFHFKRFKRSTKGILCALLATFALTATACGEGKTSSSSDDPEIPTCEHDWGEWELVSEPDCTTKGVKQRTCKTDPSHVETKEFSARGHRYDNGICSVCNDGPIFPEAPASIEYVPLTGAGGEFTRYECQEGYYEVTVHQDDTEEDTAGVEWLSFSVPSAGQYALYTVAENDELSEAVKIVRHDASFSYIPPNGHEARKLDDGNYYSSVNCGTAEWSNNWRATFAVHANAEETVRVRFVRIGDPIWSPSYVYEDAYAEEINGVKAPEPASGEILKPVEYETEYFYDETVGYYRMGTKENPGKIIYAAITADAPRVFADGALTDVYLGGGGNYSFHYGNTVEGDYKIKNYGWFLLSNGGLGTLDEHRTFIPNPSDPTANCYENFVNSDGMYPVTQELHELLVLYTKANKPSDLSSVTDPDVLANAWLAFCSYYEKANDGTVNSPYQIGLGEVEVTTKGMSFTYYTVKLETTQDAYYNVSTTQQGAIIYINGEAYGQDGNGFSVDFQIETQAGTTFYIIMQDYSKVTFTITVSEITDN